MFVSYEISLELNRAVRPIVEQIKRRDSDLAEQLRRAASSITLNLAEGARSTGGNQRQRYESAHGSASEVRGALDLAEIHGFVGDIREARQLLDRQLALLWGLTHSKKIGKPART
jgi:four helix bundle protein